MREEYRVRRKTLCPACGDEHEHDLPPIIVSPNDVRNAKLDTIPIWAQLNPCLRHETLIEASIKESYITPAGSRRFHILCRVIPYLCLKPQHEWPCTPRQPNHSLWRFFQHRDWIYIASTICIENASTYFHRAPDKHRTEWAEGLWLAAQRWTQHHKNPIATANSAGPNIYLSAMTFDSNATQWHTIWHELNTISNGRFQWWLEHCAYENAKQIVQKATNRRKQQERFLRHINAARHFILYKLNGP